MNKPVETVDNSLVIVHKMILKNVAAAPAQYFVSIYFNGCKIRNSPKENRRSDKKLCSCLCMHEKLPLFIVQPMPCVGGGGRKIPRSQTKISAPHASSQLAVCIGCRYSIADLRDWALIQRN